MPFTTKVIQNAPMVVPSVETWVLSDLVTLRAVRATGGLAIAE